MLNRNRLPHAALAAVFLLSYGYGLLRLATNLEQATIVVTLCAGAILPLLLLAAWRAPATPRSVLLRILEIARPWRIFCLALALRLLWVATSGVEPTADCVRYDRMSLDILHGGALLDPYKPTGAPLFFALHYLVAGYHPVLPQISHAVLSSLQILAILSITRATAGEYAGRAAALLLTVWPEHLLYTNLLGSDVLFASLVTFSLFLFPVGRRRVAPPLARAAAAGALLGVAQWVRPTAPLFVLALLGVTLLTGSATRRRRIATSGAILAAFALLVSPIVVLNRIDFGISSVSPAQKLGWSLLTGANPGTRGYMSREDRDALAAEVQRRPRPPETNEWVFRDRVAKEMAIRRIREHPWRTLRLYVTHKPYRLWSRTGRLTESVKSTWIGPLTPAVYLAANVWHLLGLLLAALALVGKARSRASLHSAEGAYVIAALLVTGAHVVLESQSRYHHALLGLMAILAGQALCRIVGIRSTG